MSIKVQLPPRDGSFLRVSVDSWTDDMIKELILLAHRSRRFSSVYFLSYEHEFDIYDESTFDSDGESYERCPSSQEYPSTEASPDFDLTASEISFVSIDEEIDSALGISQVVFKEKSGDCGIRS